MKEKRLFNFLKSYWIAIRKKDYRNLESYTQQKLEQGILKQNHLIYLMWSLLCQGKNNESVAIFNKYYDLIKIKEKNEKYIVKILYEYNLYKLENYQFVFDSLENTVYQKLKFDSNLIRANQIYIGASIHLQKIDNIKIGIQRLRELNYFDDELLKLEEKYMNKS